MHCHRVKHTPIQYEYITDSLQTGFSSVHGRRLVCDDLSPASGTHLRLLQAKERAQEVEDDAIEKIAELENHLAHVTADADSLKVTSRFFIT